MEPEAKTTNSASFPAMEGREKGKEREACSSSSAP